LTKINSESLLKAAGELNLQDTISDQLSILLLPQSNPSRKKLDIEEARSLVLITSHLAKQESELIRRAVILLEQVISQNQEPHLTTLLGDYLASFSNAYRERMADGKTIASGKLTQLALKLLIDLLFYSSPQGHRRLWFALLQS
jgi:hypothetical protein